MFLVVVHIKFVNILWF